MTGYPCSFFDSLCPALARTFKGSMSKILIPLLFLSGCHFGGGFTHIAPSIGSKTGRSVSDSVFFLDLNKSEYDSLGVEAPLYELNTTEGPGESEHRDSVSNCEILHDEDDPSSDEIICIMDIMEADFLTYKLFFMVSVPPGMCSHLITVPAWHYNQPAGSHQIRVYHYSSYTQTTGGKSTEVKEKFCANQTGCVSEDVLKLCPYYHSSLKNEDEKINCCLGTYTQYSMPEDTSPPKPFSPPTTNSVPDKKQWGGKATECLGGPGRTNWDEYSKDGFPMAEISYILEDGFRREYEINSLLDTADDRLYSTPIANFIEAFNKPVEELESSVPLSDLPAFLFPSPSPDLPSPSLFYSFTCKDAADETLHKINLMIREWNTHEEFMSFYDSGGEPDSGDPDITGTEGEDCEYEDSRLFPGPCNDYWDMEDVRNRDIRDIAGPGELYPPGHNPIINLLGIDPVYPDADYK